MKSQISSSHAAFYGRPYWRGSCRHTVRLSHGPGKTEENLNFHKNASRLQPGTGKGPQRHCQPKQLRNNPRGCFNAPKFPTTPSFRRTWPPPPSPHPRHPHSPPPSFRPPSRNPPTVVPHPDAVPMVGQGWGPLRLQTRSTLAQSPPPLPHHGYRFSPVRRGGSRLSAPQAGTPQPSYRTPMRYPWWGKGGDPFDYRPARRKGGPHRRSHPFPPPKPEPPNRRTAPRCGTHGARVGRGYPLTAPLCTNHAKLGSPPQSIGPSNPCSTPSSASPELSHPPSSDASHTTPDGELHTSS